MPWWPRSAANNNARLDISRHDLRFIKSTAARGEERMEFNADPPELRPGPPITYEVLRQTWLTRKLKAPASRWVAMLSAASLFLGSLLYLFNIGGAASWMAASPEQVFGAHQYWRLWTAIFAHSGLAHVLSNSLLFFILGFFLNAYFGNLVFPIGALVFGGLINALALLTYDPEITLLGASGVVYWMGGTWLALFFCLSRQYALLNRSLRTLGVGILIFMPAETFDPSVSYRTHFIGFAVGVLFGLAHFFAHKRKFRSAEVRETIIET